MGTIAGSNYCLSFADWLGTARARTDANGAMKEEYTSLPFDDMLRSWNGDYAGDTRLSPDSGSISPLHFTGKPYDEETVLDDFWFRSHDGGLGRWMTPDWSATPEAVPYAKLDNPQSLNLYSYVLNNPVSRVDPDGHYNTGCKGKTG